MALAIGLALAVGYAGSHTQFHVADDGYLWYGAQRVLAGEIPLRDFWSYDPVRYYWVAAVMAVSQSYGMVAVNMAAALFGAIGLWIAIRLIFRGQERPRWGLFVLVVVSLIFWMVPRVHLFDITASLALVATLAWMLESPTHLRCFLTGLSLGVIAIIRRDHGLYGAVAELAALAFMIWIDKRARFLPGLGYWVLGIIAGYSPMLMAAIFVPGFWTGLWASIRVYLELGATEIPLPIPWPWRALVGVTDAAEAARRMLHGMFLIAMPLFGLGVVAHSVRSTLSRRSPVDPLLLSTGLLAIPYTHYAFARADITHLAPAIFPMLVGVSILITRFPPRKGLGLAGALCILSAFLLVPMQPLYDAWHDGDWVATQVGPDTLVVSRPVAAFVTLVDKLVDTYAPAGQELIAEPTLTGAYAIANRRAAVWDIYSPFAADAVLQRSEINRIQTEHPTLVIIGNRPGAHNYSRTHPLVYNFILRRFTRVQPSFMPIHSDVDIFIPADHTK